MKARLVLEQLFDGDYELTAECPSCGESMDVAGNSMRCRNDDCVNNNSYRAPAIDLVAG